MLESKFDEFYSELTTVGQSRVEELGKSAASLISNEHTMTPDIQVTVQAILQFTENNFIFQLWAADSAPSQGALPRSLPLRGTSTVPKACPCGALLQSLDPSLAACGALLQSLDPSFPPGGTGSS